MEDGPTPESLFADGGVMRLAILIASLVLTHIYYAEGGKLLHPIVDPVIDRLLGLAPPPAPPPR